jgi:hypothetical protein
VNQVVPLNENWKSEEPVLTVKGLEVILTAFTVNILVADVVLTPT